MKKLLSFAIVACFVCAAHGQSTPPNYPYPKPRPTTGLNNAPGQTKVSQSLGPSAFSNPEPPVWARDVAGGFFSVANAAERLSLPLVIEGQIVYDASDGIFYGSYQNGMLDLPLFQLNGVWLGPVNGAQSIYTTDGTITSTTGQRIVNLGTNTLGFINGGGFLVDVPGGARFHSVSNNVDIASGQAVHIDAGNFVDIRAVNDLNVYGGQVSVHGTNIVDVIGNDMFFRSTNIMRFETERVRLGSVHSGMFWRTADSLGSGEWADLPGGGGSGATTGNGTLAGGIYTIASPTPAYTSSSVYPAFYAVDMKAATISAGGETLKVGSGPAKPIKSPNLSAIFGGDIVANSVARFVFSAADDSFILSNPASTLAFDPATLSTTTAGGVTTVAVVGGGGGTPSNGSVTAAKMGFTQTNSFMASGGPTFAGLETKLGPFFVVRNGSLRRHYANIMFELNAWSTTSTQSDTANLQQGGNGTVAGLGGLSGHAGIHTLNTLIATNSTGASSWRNDMISLDVGNKLYCFARVRLPALAVSAGEAYRFTVGFGDAATGVILDTDCINIAYSVEGGENGKWTLDVGAATLHTYTPATVGPDITVAANTWYELEFEATSTAIDWWINGTQQPTVTSPTNFPLGANKIGPYMRIVSYNGSGAATKVVHVDSWNESGVYAY